jgi:crossover junction endodeoxyribonuclease RuvC
MTATTTKVRVLGIDPGTRVVGFGILDLEAGGKPALVAQGAIRLPATPLAARLAKIYSELRGIIAKHQPHVLSIEGVFHGKNFQSVLKVGEARGVVVLAAQLEGLEICEYTPAMIKKAATGKGNAGKPQVQRMMGRILGLETAPEPADVTDALAAAFCHGQRMWRRRLNVDAGKRRAIPARAGVSSARFAPSQSGRKRATKLDIDALIKAGKARILSRGRRHAPAKRSSKS